jgi:hypothetical protein
MINGFNFVGIFVGTSVFHVELTLRLAGCNLENVAGPAPAKQSGLQRYSREGLRKRGELGPFL